MLKNYKYRVYPTKAQELKVSNVLNLCRWLWNNSLEERVEIYETEKKLVSLYNQNNNLKNLKIQYPELKNVYSQVLQNVNERLDLAFKAFFRRLKANQNPGFPRFKGKDRLNSFCYPQSGFKVDKDRIFLSKIGYIKAIWHRQVPNNIKRCTVIKSPTNKYFVVLTCEVEPNQLPYLNNPVGIDVGIRSFATLSNSSKIPNPKFFKQDKKALAKAQKKHSKEKSKKTRKVVCRIHERIKNRRENFSHQISRDLVNNYSPISIEDLNINKLKESSFKFLNREIADASWRSFSEKLIYKAEEAGRLILQVNPAYTSQDCSACGYRVEKRLSNRIHLCPNCQLELDRDVNAALNILALGTQSLA